MMQTKWQAKIARVYALEHEILTKWFNDFYKICGYVSSTLIGQDRVAGTYGDYLPMCLEGINGKYVQNTVIPWFKDFEINTPIVIHMILLDAMSNVVQAFKKDASKQLFNVIIVVSLPKCIVPLFSRTHWDCVVVGESCASCEEFSHSIKPSHMDLDAFIKWPKPQTPHQFTGPLLRGIIDCVYPPQK